MLVSCVSSFAFGKRRNYSPNERAVMKDMKHAAIENGWIDIYTGKPFSRTNRPSIEHLVPYCERNTSMVKMRGIQINGLDNIFPVGIAGNGARGNEHFATTIKNKPVILERLMKEIEKYRAYKSNLIDGEAWAARLTANLMTTIKSLFVNKNIKNMFVKTGEQFAKVA